MRPTAAGLPRVPGHPQWSAIDRRFPSRHSSLPQRPPRRHHRIGEPGDDLLLLETPSISLTWTNSMVISRGGSVTERCARMGYIPRAGLSVCAFSLTRDLSHDAANVKQHRRSECCVPGIVSNGFGNPPWYWPACVYEDTAPAVSRMIVAAAAGRAASCWCSNCPSISIPWSICCSSTAVKLRRMNGWLFRERHDSACALPPIGIFHQPPIARFPLGRRNRCAITRRDGQGLPLRQCSQRRTGPCLVAWCRG